MQFDLFGIVQQPQKTKPKQWIDWDYSLENPHPKLPKNKIINIRFRSGWESTNSPEKDKPFGYWLDKDFNGFKWLQKYPEDDVVAYQVLN